MKENATSCLNFNASPQGIFHHLILHSYMFVSFFLNIADNCGFVQEIQPEEYLRRSSLQAESNLSFSHIIVACHFYHPSSVKDESVKKTQEFFI